MKTIEKLQCRTSGVFFTRAARKRAHNDILKAYVSYQRKPPWTDKKKQKNKLNPEKNRRKKKTVTDRKIDKIKNKVKKKEAKKKKEKRNTSYKTKRS